MHSWRPLLAASALAATVAVAAPARAEYAELGMAKEFGTMTFFGFGAAAAVLDGFSVDYLRRGEGPENGRRIVAALQVVDAGLLVASGVTWHRLAGEARQGRDRAMNVLTGAHLVVGAASLGLGIATYLSHAGPP